MKQQFKAAGKSKTSPVSNIKRTEIAVKIRKQVLSIFLAELVTKKVFMGLGHMKTLSTHTKHSTKK
ncbi:hypothetical protein [Massilia glaciei]|uniref:hypothetical protein n=1 Tax=Massilia glaciei TaxID=1524097 RepID=UPI0011B1FE34|nr:hypothetical protein [Massilia glaciei]